MQYLSAFVVSVAIGVAVAMLTQEPIGGGVAALAVCLFLTTDMRR